MVGAEREKNLLAFSDVLAVPDAHHDCAHHLATTLPAGEVVAADFSPEHACPIQYVEAMGIVHFDFVSDIRAVNDGDIVAVPRLHPVDALVDVVFVRVTANHCDIIRLLTSLASQIKTP